MNDTNATRYLRGLLNYLSEDIGYQMNLLMSVVERIKNEPVDNEPTLSESAEEQSTQLLLIPLNRKNENLMDQIRILESAQQHLAQTSRIGTCGVSVDRRKVDWILSAVSCISDNRENQMEILKGALLRQTKVVCWP